MFVINLYMTRPIAADECKKLRDLVARSCEKKGLPFGSHYVTVCGMDGQDSLPIFLSVSEAGLNVTLEQLDTPYAVMNTGCEVDVQHDQILYL